MKTLHIQKRVIQSLYLRKKRWQLSSDLDILFKADVPGELCYPVLSCPVLCYVPHGLFTSSVGPSIMIIINVLGPPEPVPALEPTEVLNLPLESSQLEEGMGWCGRSFSQLNVQVEDRAKCPD